MRVVFFLLSVFCMVGSIQPVEAQSPQETIDHINSEPKRIIERALKSPKEVNATGMFGRTALHWAAKQRQRAEVSKLLEMGADPNAVDKLGTAVILDAAHSGDPEIVRMLLERGATVPPQGWQSLSWDELIDARIQAIRLKEQMSSSEDPSFRKDAQAITVGTEAEYKEIRVLLIKHGAKFKN